MSLDKKAIIQHISDSICELPDSCQEEFFERSKLISVDKKQILIREEQYSDKMFFVVEGALRAYYLKKGNDVTDWFAFENEFICSIQSFFTGVPSPHFVEVISDSILLEISQSDIFFLSEKYREFERMGNLLTTQTMLQLQQRVVSLQFETAQQKYLNLLKEKPDIELRVPLIHIASYLGITIETLSRIRSKKEKI